jgi:ankyrin
MRLLLDAGANAEAVHPGTGCTVLHFAVVGRSVKTVCVLLSAGVDVDAMCKEGYTPLMRAVNDGTAAIVAILLGTGADPSRTGMSVTPLHGACKLGRLEIAGMLLRAGADPTTRHAGGVTALNMAIEEGHTGIVRLLSTVVNVEEIGPGDDTTPLWTAAALGKVEIVQVLLEAGADETRRNRSGWTLLHAVALSGSIEMMRVVLKAGVEPDYPGDSELTPVQLCAAARAPRGKAWLTASAR